MWDESFVLKVPHYSDIVIRFIAMETGEGGRMRRESTLDLEGAILRRVARYDTSRVWILIDSGD